MKKKAGIQLEKKKKMTKRKRMAKMKKMAKRKKMRDLLLSKVLIQKKTKALKSFPINICYKILFRWKHSV